MPGLGICVAGLYRYAGFIPPGAEPRGATRDHRHFPLFKPRGGDERVHVTPSNSFKSVHVLRRYTGVQRDIRLERIGNFRYGREQRKANFECIWAAFAQKTIVITLPITDPVTQLVEGEQRYENQIHFLFLHTITPERFGYSPVIFPDRRISVQDKMIQIACFGIGPADGPAQRSSDGLVDDRHNPIGIRLSEFPYRQEDMGRGSAGPVHLPELCQQSSIQHLPFTIRKCPALFEVKGAHGFFCIIRACHVHTQIYKKKSSFQTTRFKAWEGA